MFDSFLQDPEVSRFILNYRKIDSNNKFCKGNILGLNVDQNKNIVTEKFYFSTSFILSKDQILKFLPTPHDLLETYRFVDFSSDPICKRGVTFAIKKTSNGLIKQFHFKVPSIYYNSPKLTKHKTVFLPEHIFDGTETYAVCYEYRGQASYLKNYVYFKNEKAKKYFTESANIDIACDTVEFTDSNFGSKIILINSKINNNKMFPSINKNLIYKNFGFYITKKEYSAYIYPKNYEKLEKYGKIDTISFLNEF